MMKLSDEFLKTQRESLIEEKNKIEEKINRLKKYPDYGSDEEDNLQEIADYESNLSIDEQLEFLLGKIKRALSAMDDGTYGKCASCKQEIEEGRLEIMPYAELCVTCNTQRKK